MGLELVTVRLHDPTGDDLATAELPARWILEPGDLLAADDQLVVVQVIVPSPPASAIAALVKVAPTPGFNRS